jgi:hypothetical protein
VNGRWFCAAGAGRNASLLRGIVVYHDYLKPSRRRNRANSSRVCAIA